MNSLRRVKIHVLDYFARPKFINIEERSIDASHRYQSRVMNTLNINTLYYYIKKTKRANL